MSATDGLFANDDTPLDPKEDPKNHCPYCTHYVDYANYVKRTGTSCDDCQRWYHFKCLQKFHTWRGETISLPPNFFVWLDTCPLNDEEPGFSFICANCDPGIPPLLMQLWSSKTLTFDEALALKVYQGPLSQYAREHPIHTHESDVSEHDSQANEKEETTRDTDLDSQPDPTKITKGIVIGGTDDSQLVPGEKLHISLPDKTESFMKMIMEMNSQMMKEQRASLAAERERDREERAALAEKDREERATLLAALLQWDKVPLPSDISTPSLAELGTSYRYSNFLRR